VEVIGFKRIDEVLRAAVRRQDADHAPLFHSVEVAGPRLGDFAERNPEAPFFARRLRTSPAVTDRRTEVITTCKNMSSKFNGSWLRELSGRGA
jgi:hypothetical protein